MPKFWLHFLGRFLGNFSDFDQDFLGPLVGLGSVEPELIGDDVIDSHPLGPDLVLQYVRRELVSRQWNAINCKQ